VFSSFPSCAQTLRMKRWPDVHQQNTSEKVEIKTDGVGSRDRLGRPCNILMQNKSGSSRLQRSRIGRKMTSYSRPVVPGTLPVGRAATSRTEALASGQ
jgi:hypothetical protein